jgi:hypothetical protein
MKTYSLHLALALLASACLPAPVSARHAFPGPHFLLCEVDGDTVHLEWDILDVDAVLERDGDVIAKLPKGLLSYDDFAVAPGRHLYRLVIRFDVPISRECEAEVFGPAVAYELEEASSFTQGCYPPCLCPIFIVEGLRGSFRLIPRGLDGLFALYAVEDVDWTLPGEPPRSVRGSGTYRVGGESASMHQLELDLSIDGEAAQHFDSGLIAGGGEFPRISIAVSVNGMVCFDTVFDIRAKLKPSEERFVRGDCNGDGALSGEVTDAVFLLRFNFLGGERPPCLAACDANGDGDVGGQVSDAVYMLLFNFLGGPPPPPPFPDCGTGGLPGDSGLGCVTSPTCP